MAIVKFNLSRVLFLGVVVVGATALSCDQPNDVVETRSGALSAATSRVVVPAYWGGTAADWNKLETGTHPLRAGDVVIANPNEGSGGVFDSNLYTHLSTLHGRGVLVLGYVKIGLEGEGINNAYNEVWAWNWFYGGMNTATYGAPVLDGIFYDEASRLNDEDIKRLRYVAEVVQAGSMTWASGLGYTMFNFGSPYGERNYADCLMQVAQSAGDATRALFVSQETGESFYRGLTPDNNGNYNTYNWTTSSWNWVDNYKPAHFAQIVHDATTTTSNTQDAVAKARGWNAAYVYVTDGLNSGDTYGAAPADQIWSDLMSGTGSAHNDFGGASSESYTSSCPASCDGGDCWCEHALCETGVALTSTCNSCVTEICNADAFCCQSENSWDDQCVSEVSSVCGWQCPGN
jgi:hypothetical protein